MRRASTEITTDIELRNLKAGEKDDEFAISGVPGLSVRVSTGGRKSFRLRYRVAPSTEQRSMALGRYPDVTLKEARAAAHEALGHAAKGTDPAAAVRKAREQADPQYSFAALRERYVNEHCNANMKERSAKEAGRCLRVDWGDKAGFDKKDARTITPEMVVKRLSAINALGQHDANTLAILKGLYRWLKGKQIVTIAPTDGVRHNSKSKPRSRYLTDEEIVRVWIAADKIGYPYGHVVKLFLLTCTRRNEVAGMQWSELDYDEARWIMPHERTKKRRNSDPKPHLVPLSSLALELLKDCPSSHDVFVFPAERSDSKTGHIANWNARKTQLDKLSGVEGFNQHDTRRTVTTGLGRIRLSNGQKVARHVKAALIHHSGGKDDTMGKHYDQYEYEDEKREALEAWAHHINGLLKRHAEQSARVAPGRGDEADNSLTDDAMAV